MKGNLPNPYVGPRPYTRDDAARFFGRELETDALIATITAQQITLLYAESGAGKTSLLHAKIIPGLEDDGCQVILRKTKKEPARVRPTIDIPDSPAPKNVFTFHALASIEDLADPSWLVQTSLATYIRETRTPRSDSIPVPPPRVLIFDQFEEIFTTSVEKWAQRRGFFRDIAMALEEDSRLRVVFAMREEYLASLDPYLDELPGGGRTRFRLERLRKVDALKAVIGPVKQTQSVRWGKGTAQKIVRNLRQATSPTAYAGEYVEPLHLQVVCYRLWESLPTDTTEISPDFIAVHADVEQALEDYYEEKIKAVCNDKELQSAGITPPKLRTWFERHLVTPEKTRAIVYVEVGSTGGLRNAVVKQLEDHYLIRAEFRGSAKWYELSHDRLVRAVLASNARWRQTLQGGEMIMRLEMRARAWKDPGGANVPLLSAPELAEIEKWKASGAGADFELGAELHDFIAASKYQIERETNERMRRERELEREATERMQRERRYLRIGVVLAVFLVLAVGGLWAVEKRRKDLLAERDRNRSTLIALGAKVQREERLKLEAEKLAALRQQQRLAQEKLRTDAELELKKAELQNIDLQRKENAKLHEALFNYIRKGVERNLPEGGDGVFGGNPRPAVLQSLEAYRDLRDVSPKLAGPARKMLERAVAVDEAGGNIWRLRSPGGMNNISVSRDGLRVATSSPTEFCLWDLEAKSYRCDRFPRDTGGRVRLSPSGKRLLFLPPEGVAWRTFAASGATAEGGVGVASHVLKWDGSAVDKSRLLDGTKSVETFLAITPDDKLVLWKTDGGISIRGPQSEVKLSLPLLQSSHSDSMSPQEVESVLVAPSGKHLLISGDEYYTVRLDSDGRPNTPKLLDHELFSSGVETIAFSDDGTRLLFRGIAWGGEVTNLVIDTETGAVLFQMTIPDSPAAVCQLSADGKKVAIVRAGKAEIAVDEYDIAAARAASPTASRVMPIADAGVTTLDNFVVVGLGINGEENTDTLVIYFYDPFANRMEKLSEAIPNGEEGAFFTGGGVILNAGEAIVFNSAPRQEMPAAVDELVWRACQRLCLGSEWQIVAETCEAQAKFDCVGNEDIDQHAGSW